MGAWGWLTVMSIFLAILILIIRSYGAVDDT